MEVEVRVPQLSESVSEATLLNWSKQEGEAVAEGENLIDVETDKVVLDLPAPASGVLVKILRKDGEVVTGGEVIALLDTAQESGVRNQESGDREQGAGGREKKEQVAHSPSVRKLAHEKDVDVDSLLGSGRDGRVTREDVLKAAQPAKPVPSLTRGEGVTAGRTEQRVPMTRIRRRIAERLLQSQQNAAILTTFNEVNMQPVMELRNKYKEAFERKHGIKLGFTSFFVHAVVRGLQQFPAVNASVDGADIIYHGYYDIGVAIGSERGLVVPIIRDADKLSFADIEKQVADFAERAKEGKLALEELAGGTFSITNGGVFGSMLSTPIINPPQSAILGIHATKDRPVAENGKVVIRPMNYLALSYDHRIIDGRDAVLFLVAIKEALEYPGRELLDI